MTIKMILVFCYNVSWSNFIVTLEKSHFHGQDVPMEIKPSEMKICLLIRLFVSFQNGTFVLQTKTSTY